MPCTPKEFLVMAFQAPISDLTVKQPKPISILIPGGTPFILISCLLVSARRVASSFLGSFFWGVLCFRTETKDSKHCVAKESQQCSVSAWPDWVVGACLGHRERGHTQPRAPEALGVSHWALVYLIS